MENEQYADPNEEIKAIEGKLGLVFSIITVILTILIATITVLLKGPWWVVLSLGLIVGSGMAALHNWLGARMALKYNLEVSYNAMERLYKAREQQQQPQRSVVVYIEEPVKKDPRYHSDDPENYK